VSNPCQRQSYALLGCDAPPLSTAQRPKLVLAPTVYNTRLQPTNAEAEAEHADRKDSDRFPHLFDVSHETSQNSYYKTFDVLAYENLLKILRLHATRSVV
jgi:hypothetical protein